MSNTILGGGSDIERAQHRRRQLIEYRCFQASDGIQPGMFGCARVKLDPCIPSFTQCFRRCVSHPGKRFDAVQFTQAYTG
ncbi:hypothetical protein D3C86_1783480 [compost metagenome]